MSDTPGAIPPPPPQPAGSVPERPGAAKTGRRLRRIAAAVALLIFMSAGVYLTTRYFSLYRSQIRTIETMRALGLPMTYRQMDAMYEMPPVEENGAYVYEEAFRIVQAAWGELSETESEALQESPELFETDGHLPDETAALIDAFLANTSDAWELIARAQSYPVTAFPLDFSQGRQLPLTHLAPMRNIARLHALRAIRSIVSADIEDAINMIESSAKLQEALQHEPYIIGLLVRHAMIRMNVDSAENALSARQLQADELNRVEAAFDFEFGSEDHIRALNYEFAFVIDIESPIDMGGSADEDLAILRKAFGDSGSAYFRNRFSSFTAVNLRLAASSFQLNLREALSEPYPEQISTLSTIRSNIDALGFHQVIAKIFVPAMIQSGYALARIVALLDALRVAVDIERYRLATGALPESLEALVPEYRAEIPIDPFDGQPLRYLRFPEGGYAVYSIGDDFDDDGATPWRSLGDGESDGDVVIRVRR